MPTYDYRCPNGHDFERFYRKISEAATEVECPVCGALASRRVSAGAGLLFKGSGFYLTDYGKNAHRKGGPDAGGAAGDSGSGGGESAKSDAGSGAKTDAASGGSKSDGAKSTDSTSSSKAKGADNK
jgi:putative FmdB family regulatory protein